MKSSNQATLDTIQAAIDAKNLEFHRILCGIATRNCEAFINFIQETQTIPELISPVPLAKGADQWLQWTKTMWGKDADENGTPARFCVAFTPDKTGSPRSVGDAAPDSDDEELLWGTWVKVNRLLKPGNEGSGPKKGWTNSDCATEYMLVEMDRTPLELQMLFWRAAISLGFPVFSLTRSGNKSIHAVIRLNAANQNDYKTKVDEVFKMLEPLVPDFSTGNPSRFTRMPGMRRTKIGDDRKRYFLWQELEYLNPDAEAWDGSKLNLSALLHFQELAEPLPEKLKRKPSFRPIAPSGEMTPEQAAADLEWKKRFRALNIEGRLDLVGILHDVGWFIDTCNAGAEVKHFCSCPWHEEHSGGGEVDTPTDAYFYVRNTDAKFPFGFHCAHATCKMQERDALSAMELVKEDYPEVWKDAQMPEPDLTSLLPVIDDLEVQGTTVDVPGEYLTGSPCDMTNAQIFEFGFKGRAKFLHDTKKWILWTRHGWKVDHRDKLFDLAEYVARIRMEKCENADNRLAFRKVADAPVIDRFMRKAAARDSMADESSSFDTDPDLLGLPNGSLDTRTGVLLPLNPDHKILRRASVPYNRGAECPHWRQFLAEIHPGQPEVTDFLRRWAGYCLTGQVSEHKMAIFFGGGRNGKGTFVNMINSVLGDYGFTAPQKFMTEASKSAASNAPNAALMATRGVRMSSISETKATDQMDDGFVKMLVSGDPVSARQVYGTRMEVFTPTSKFVLSTNHLPRIAETDEGIWSKLLPVEFGEHFTPEQIRAKGDLAGLLRAESEGVLRWMVEGCMEWREIGLCPPQSVLDCRKRYRGEQDMIGNFLHECTTEAGGEHCDVPLPDLYARFKLWAPESGHAACSAINFNRKLRERGQVSRSSHGADYWTGLSLKELSPI